MGTWTQDVSLTWAPCLTFYEERTPVLRALHDRGLLSAFLHTDQALGARFSPNMTLEAKSIGLEMAIGSPTSDRETAQEVMRIVLEAVNPPEIVVQTIRVQILEPIALDYDVARRQLTADLTRQWEVAGAVGVDVAVLLDGRSSKVNSSFQVEFGIVNDNEAPGRLTRAVGRMGNPWPARAGIVDTNGLPPCGLFFDWTWYLQEKVGSADTVGRIFAILSDVEAEAARLSAGIQVRTGLAGDTMRDMEASQ